MSKYGKNEGDKICIWKYLDVNNYYFELFKTSEGIRKVIDILIITEYALEREWVNTEYRDRIFPIFSKIIFENHPVMFILFQLLGKNICRS